MERSTPNRIAIYATAVQIRKDFTLNGLRKDPCISWDIQWYVICFRESCLKFKLYLGRSDHYKATMAAFYRIFRCPCPSWYGALRELNISSVPGNPVGLHTWRAWRCSACCTSHVCGLANNQRSPSCFISFAVPAPLFGFAYRIPVAFLPPVIFLFIGKTIMEKWLGGE